MRAVALDPGGTTGWATFDVQMSQGVPTWRKPLKRHFDYGQMGGNFEHHKLVWLFLQSREPDLIIGERFDNRGNEFAKVVSREYIGIIKLYSSMTRTPVVWQGAADMAFADDRKLELLGLLAKPISSWPHANDAMRHMIHWLCCTDDTQYAPLRHYFLIQLHQLAET